MEEIKYDYNDKFKEDLIHQLIHVVIELGKINKNLCQMIEQNEYT